MRVDILGSRDDAAALIVQADGRIMAAGGALEGASARAALIRVNS